MKKILFIADGLGSGGAERQMITIAQQLKVWGYNVYVLSYSGDIFFAHLLLDKAIPIIWEIEKIYIKRLIKIRRYIRKGNFDAVISFLETPNFINNFSAIGGKSWTVITGERSAKEQTFYSKRGKIFGWFQRYSDGIVCNSYNAKRMWEKYYPNYKEKLSVIYNHVFIPQINTEYIPRKNGKTNIIIAASYQYLKNPIGLIKAVLLLSEQEKEKIEIRWYGQKKVTNSGTKTYDESLKLIKENNLERIIYLNEASTDILNIMNNADVIGLFSELEGLPNAICEGMMLGKPIIMSRVSDYDVLVDERNGLLCDWDKPETIKDALSRVLCMNDKELIEKGRDSKEKAEKLFSPIAILEEWLNIIK